MSLDVYLDVANECVYEANITHNLTKMAQEAGIYDHMWYPQEAGVIVAKQLIDPLREALHFLKLDRERFEAFDPPNGWGDYEGLVQFIQLYLDACYKYPEATVSVSR